LGALAFRSVSRHRSLLVPWQILRSLWRACCVKSCLNNGACRRPLLPPRHPPAATERPAKAIVASSSEQKRHAYGTQALLRNVASVANSSVQIRTTPGTWRARLKKGRVPWPNMIHHICRIRTRSMRGEGKVGTAGARAGCRRCRSGAAPSRPRRRARLQQRRAQRGYSAPSETT